MNGWARSQFSVDRISGVIGQLDGCSNTNKVCRYVGAKEEYAREDKDRVYAHRYVLIVEAQRRRQGEAL